MNTYIHVHIMGCSQTCQRTRTSRSDKVLEATLQKRDSPQVPSRTPHSDCKWHVYTCAMECAFEKDVLHLANSVSGYCAARPPHTLCSSTPRAFLFLTGSSPTARRIVFANVFSSLLEGDALWIPCSFIFFIF